MHRVWARVGNAEGGYMIKGLTISQPWASLIASGEKPVENRGWFTNYRGPLAIHAGQGTQCLTREELKKVPTSCVLAVVRLSACVTIDAIQSNARTYGGDFIPGTRLTWGEIAKHKYTEGPWCLILERVFRLPKPIPCKGKLSLWTPSESFLASLREQYDWEAAA